MKKWEYMHVFVDRTNSINTDCLNKLGGYGWEVVAAHGDSAILKRELAPDAPTPPAEAAQPKVQWTPDTEDGSLGRWMKLAMSEGWSFVDLHFDGSTKTVKGYAPKLPSAAELAEAVMVEIDKRPADPTYWRLHLPGVLRDRIQRVLDGGK